MPEKVLRAAYSEKTVRVYQAYRPEIAMPALASGTFVPPFQMDRMTWIKPSFNWMMYRSGYGSKPGQEVVLGIDITRDGFDWALKHSVPSVFGPDVHTSHEEWRRLLEEMPVRIQWDPERDCRLRIVEDVRAIQVGLSGEAVRRYVHEWIVRIEDVTDVAHRIREEVQNGITPRNRPDEHEVAYPLDSDLRNALCLR